MINTEEREKYVEFVERSKGEAVLRPCGQARTYGKRQSPTPSRSGVEPQSLDCHKSGVTATTPPSFTPMPLVVLIKYFHEMSKVSTAAR